MKAFLKFSIPISLIIGILFTLHPFLDIASGDRVRRERATEALMSEDGPPFGWYFLFGTIGGVAVSSVLYAKMKK